MEVGNRQAFCLVCSVEEKWEKLPVEILGKD